MCGLVRHRPNQNSEGGFSLMSRLILSLSVFSRSPFQTISSRHKQILPYLSKNTRSVGGFPHMSFTAAVMIKMASATAHTHTKKSNTDSNSENEAHMYVSVDLQQREGKKTKGLQASSSYSSLPTRKMLTSPSIVYTI